MSALPFPHIVIDEFIKDELAAKAFEEFPKPNQAKWYSYDNSLERKLANPHLEGMPVSLRSIFQYFMSTPFLELLEELTGIAALQVDEGLYGGGLHQIEQGGKLDIHADFNIHPEKKWRRRINLLWYVNRGWSESYGGNLELWNSNMTKMERSISPLFNRAVIFKSDDNTFHGHPDPLRCPLDTTRKSLAVYYYTSDATQDVLESAHSTLYQVRPFDRDNDELRELRKLRARGRVKDLINE